MRERAREYLSAHAHAQTSAPLSASLAQVYGEDGSFLRSHGGYGLEEGKFHFPCGVAVDKVRWGKVWPCFKGWISARAYTRLHLHVNAACICIQERILVSDCFNHRVQVCLLLQHVCAYSSVRGSLQMFVRKRYQAQIYSGSNRSR